MLLKSEGLLERPVSSADFLPTKLRTLLTWHFQQDAGIRNHQIIDKSGDEIRPVQAGRCYMFDGVDDYIDCGDIGNNLTSLSCFAWIKTTASATGYVLSRYETLSNQRSFFIGVNTTGVLDVFLSEDGQYANSSKIYESTTVVNDGDWHHVGFTWGSGSLKVYIDGLEATVTKTQDDIFTEIHDSTNPFLIGAIRTGIENFDGSIYGAQVFNSALSSLEVSKVYNDLNDYGTMPIGFWKCDEGGGSVAYDSSGNEYNGTIINTTLTTFHSTDTEVVKSWQNDVGYSWIAECSDNYWYLESPIRSPQEGDVWEAVVAEYNGSSQDAIWGERTASDNTWAGLSYSSGDFTPIMSFFVYTSGSFSSGGFDLRTYKNFKVRFTFNATECICQIFDQNNVEIYHDSVTITSFNPPSSTSFDLEMFGATAQASGSARRAFNGSLRSIRIQWDGNDEKWTFEDQGSGNIKSNESGLVAFSYAGSSIYNVKVPRNESDTSNDVLGSALQCFGRVKYNLDLINSNCATFDGVNDHIVSNAYGAASNEALSFCCWVKLSTIDPSGGIMVYGLSNTYDESISISQSTDGFNFAVRYTASQMCRLRTKALSAGQWYHLVFTYDGSEDVSGIKFYLNGTDDTANGVTFENTLSTTFSLDDSFYLARYNSAYSDGKMADVRVYNKELNAQEVSRIYNGEHLSTSPIQYFPLAEGAGAKVYDASGNENHGDIQNATLATLWGSQQDVFHYNLLKGFSEEYTIQSINDFTLYTLEDTGIDIYLTNGDGINQSLFSLQGADMDGSSMTANGVYCVRNSANPNAFLGISSTQSFLPNSQWEVGITYTIRWYLHSADQTDLIYLRFWNGSSFESNIGFNTSQGWKEYIFTPTASSGSAFVQIYQQVSAGDGFTINGIEISQTGVKIPALSDASDDAMAFGLINRAFHGHNDAETKVKMPEVAPAIKQADDNLTNSFWYTGSSINELTFEDLSNNPDADNILYLEHKTNRKENLCMFEAALSSQQNTEMNEFIS